MKTYKEGYTFGTQLTKKIEAGEVSKKVAEDLANLPGGQPTPYRQGIIDSCADWLHKTRLLDKEIARREKERKEQGG